MRAKLPANPAELELLKAHLHGGLPSIRFDKDTPQESRKARETAFHPPGIPPLSRLGRLQAKYEKKREENALAKWLAFEAVSPERTSIFEWWHIVKDYE